jgi:phosphatidylserine/phosphatidylglycerophosphate/cardiolipin synthase-like enzyme
MRSENRFTFIPCHQRALDRRRLPYAPHSCLAMLLTLLSFLASVGYAAEIVAPARVAVYFSPHGGATDAVVRAVHAAKTQVLVQAYSFTSAPIAKALVDAHKRGVTVLAVLDTSHETEQYSAATFLVNAGIQTLIDDQHAIAHNKVMVIDSATILTGSFHFTKAVEEKNAENLLVIIDAPELVTAYEQNIRAYVAHAHPSGRPASGPSAGIPAAMTSKHGEIHGNKHSTIYHRPGCPGSAGMQPTSLVTFGSEAEAEQAGYRKAKNCP